MYVGVRELDSLGAPLASPRMNDRASAKSALRRMAQLPGAGKAVRLGRDVALRTGLMKHRPWVWPDEQWSERYIDGTLDYFASLTELARYSLIAGYVRAFGPRVDLLDVGCGQGVLRSQLARDTFASYTGIDPTDAAIEAARRLEDDQTRFIAGDIADLQHSYDVVVCNEVLSVVPDPVAMLDVVHRLVRPGGHLVTSIWRHPGDQQLWRLVDARFSPVDAVVARNESNRIGSRGWRVACHRRGD
jgi:SAM-dependent methyltransferase